MTVRSQNPTPTKTPAFVPPKLPEIMNVEKPPTFSFDPADLPGAVDYDAIDWKSPRLLVIGSEATGLEPEIVEQMDDVIRIPMESNVEGLNLAVAAGVILFEAARQYRSASNEYF